MLERIFGPKTIKEFEKEKGLLNKDISIINKIVHYLDKNGNLCTAILNFAVKGENLRNLLKSLLSIEHLLAESESKERRISIKAIEILESRLKSAEDSEVKNEISQLLLLLKGEKAVLEEILMLDTELTKKRYSQQAVSRLVPRVRESIKKQLALFESHKFIIKRLLNKLSEEESKINGMLEPIYGRALSGAAYNCVKESAILTDLSGFVPCFILTSTIAGFFKRKNVHKGSEILTGMFKSIGVRGADVVILFKISKSQDLSLLAKCPPPQPQKISGLIEQKLPSGIMIEITNKFSF